MSRRKEALPVEQISIATKFPWWVWIVLAIAAYLALDHFATLKIVATTNHKDIWRIFTPMFRGFAMIGQYLLPFMCLIGSLVSFIYRIKRRTRINEPSWKRDALGNHEQRHEPSLHPNEQRHEPPPRPNAWSLNLLQSMDWKRFEEVCAEYFRLRGFHAETQSHGPDGGIDITLYSPNDQTQIANIVQCKRWSRQVGPKLMRELLGVMTANKVPRGTFVTSSSFNDDATRFAAENGIYLIDGKQFLQRILRRPAAEQARLLEVATEGDYLTPTCASCGIKMVARQSSKDKSVFWGCLNFPRCRFILTVSGDSFQSKGGDPSPPWPSP